MDAEREEWQQALLERCQTLQDDLEAVRKQNDVAAAAVVASTSAAAASAAADQVCPVWQYFMPVQLQHFHHKSFGPIHTNVIHGNEALCQSVLPLTFRYCNGGCRLPKQRNAGSRATRLDPWARVEIGPRAAATSQLHRRPRR